MHTFVRNALWGTLIAGGITLLGATASSAAETNGEDGLLSGTQLDTPISATVDVVDNALAILGTSTVEAPPAEVAPEPAPAPAPAVAQTPPEPVTTDGTNGVASGSQAIVNADVPVTVTGNSIAVLGESAVSNDAAATAPTTPGESSDGVTGEAMTDGTDAVLGGTQVLAPVSLPVTIGGNGVAVLGESSVTGSTPGVVPGPLPGDGTDPVPGADPGMVTPPGVVAASAPTVMAASAEMLALTGGAGVFPLALIGLALLGIGGVLLRRRVS